MAWQLIVTEVFRHNHPDFSEALKYGDDEPCDLTAGKDAIDTKYRIGSGDSGTLKKFKQYGHLLKQKGYNPVLLILRLDNLNAAISACKVGGWQVLTGFDTFNYIQAKTGIDLMQLLKSYDDKYHINR